jgi:ribosomal protein L28
MKQCQICGKGSSLGGKRIKLRGHYNPQPLTRKHPNLQKTALPTGERILACAQCIKTLAKKKRS